MVVLSVALVFITSILGARQEPLPTFGELPDFTLTNQFGRAVTKGDLSGNIWVANIIFTRCPGPCTDMTRRMKAIQDGLPPGSPVQLLSLTADPEFDTSEVLKRYADRFNADSKKWLFLTGPKDEVYALAKAGLKLAVEENTDRKPDEDPFIHSTRMVLVDGFGRLRAVSSDASEAEAVEEILRAADRLMKER